MAILIGIKNRFEERVELSKHHRPTEKRASLKGGKNLSNRRVRMETTVSEKLKSIRISWEFGENIQNRNEIYERERKLMAS